MPVSPDRYTRTQNRDRQTALKRLGIIAGFVLLLIQLVANTLIPR